MVYLMMKTFFFQGWLSGMRLRTPESGYEKRKREMSFTV
jgi:hypothetical protein